MFKLLLVFSAVVCVWSAAVPAGVLPQLDGRIVGGVATTIASAPWQVSILYDGSLICGGSIYNPDTIITAAHCLQFLSSYRLRIRAGSSYWRSGGVLVNVASFKKHEYYNPRTMVNDIAVIKLASSLTYSANIKAIGMANSAPANGAPAVVTGWGTTSHGTHAFSDQLRYIDVNIVSTTNCSSSTYTYGASIKPTMICAIAPGKDSCQGDSGGPLVSGGALVGIVSWGYGCAQPNYPGIYTDVSAFLPWVDNHI